jgi:ribonuclease HI
MKENTITIFTDGSSRGNPGAGGWGAVVIMPLEQRVVELGGHEGNTTNNRMEITAALNALLHIKHLNEDVVVYTDSSYLISGITQWVKGWLKNGWTTSTNEAVINRDLWELLTSVLETRRENGSTVEWKKVSGHAGVPANERCDVIATKYADGKEPELYNGDMGAYEVDIHTIVPDADAQGTKNSKKSRSKEKAYSYISLIDGKIKTYDTWEACEKDVKGVKGVKYKKSLSEEDEKSIIAEWTQ